MKLRSYSSDVTSLLSTLNAQSSVRKQMLTPVTSRQRHVTSQGQGLLPSNKGF